MPPPPSDCLSAAFPFFLSSFRQQSISWRCSATIFLMLELIQSLMAHILFAVEAANGCQCNSVGLFVASVSGGAGAPSSHTWPLWSTLFPGTTIPPRPRKTFLTLASQLSQNALHVEDHAIAPKGQATWKLAFYTWKLALCDCTSCIVLQCSITILYFNSLIDLCRPSVLCAPSLSYTIACSVSHPHPHLLQWTLTPCEAVTCCTWYTDNATVFKGHEEKCCFSFFQLDTWEWSSRYLSAIFWSVFMIMIWFPHR